MNIKKSAPGKSYRKGISLIGLMEMFPDERSARHWMESIRWPDGEKHCPKCGSGRITNVKDEKPQPYRCKDCRRFFSVRIGTVFENSPIPLRKWAVAVFLHATSLKGVSSMKLHRDLNISQPSAWFMAHRIREAFKSEGDLFTGPVEVDETYMGGKEGNKHEYKKLKQGRGPTGKSAVIGVKDRKTNKISAKKIDNTKRKTLHSFIQDNVEEWSEVFTDDFKSYEKLANYEHGTVKHSVGEYVNEQIHINGMESFWSMLKRAHKGTFHQISPKHLQRYVDEFAGRHNIRELDTIIQMNSMVAGMIGRRLMYKNLISDRF